MGDVTNKDGTGGKLFSLRLDDTATRIYCSLCLLSMPIKHSNKRYLELSVLWCDECATPQSLFAADWHNAYQENGVQVEAYNHSYKKLQATAFHSSFMLSLLQIVVKEIRYN